ncbi:hypothetical protein HOI26_01680 [Candidatus Woesearchaeota archaeon]|jgi:hypothetical protein|nr:hypothetical protein [Candidatus Woesearchaeota archaeon]MBT5739786.1 hypothetical protein [Candidatus Woesearchaeota archaeon]
MKRRTKKKLNKFAVKSVRGLFILILIYPFKLLWFLLKQLFYVIFKRKKPTKKERKVKIETTTKPIEGKKKNIPEKDEFVEVKHKRGKLQPFVNKLYTNKSTIGLILGARGTGKSAIGMRLLENVKAQTDRKIYTLGFKPSALPKWMTVVKSIEDIENDAFVLVDEGGIEFSSRNSMSDANTLLSELLLIARHKDLSILFITQNSANLEINVIRQADYLLLKPSSLLQKDFERKKIKDIYSAADDEFSELSEHKGLTYIYADSYKGFVNNSLPSFWDEKVSKGYAER